MGKVTAKRGLSKRFISPARPFDNHKLRTRRRPSSARKKHVLNVEMGSALTKTQGFLNDWDKQIMRFDLTDRVEYEKGWIQSPPALPHSQANREMLNSTEI